MESQLEQREIVVKVKRYNQEKGEYWQEYKLVVDRFTQMTEVLRRIKSEQDPTLAYRASCHMAVCGSCAMRINGEPRLACKTLALDIVKKYDSNQITVEPMDYFKVQKDLIVDMDEFYARMFKVKPRLYPSKEVVEGRGEHRLRPEDQRELWKFAQCIWCGLCVSACPAVRIDEEFLGPAAHAKGYRFLADPRDTIYDERLKILADSAWRCTYCYQCFNVCPRDVEPVTTIKKTRAHTRFLKDKSEVAKTGEKHVKAIFDSIRETGKLEEAKVYITTYGLAAAITDMLYTMRNGKVNLALIREKKVSQIDQIQKLMGEKE
ncbi:MULTISPECIES: succinate dehydrogenase/fumarate reductase iron-sulfur subunit [Metallosphaera]|uniref:succinate dehydrogenase n=3 Tax=Metallosphaera TaxID=41980 RepID=A4YEJ9_METS5|nr:MULTISPECIES: succinate dehydrogenase/fumarate reductase iron-sulfur subunit [Metallosphaera]ABP94851.1 succinate dehydrogenase subunit B [Metallosphaera sedula DSM 5348]AIM26838.1 succinate dehydrogenase subunit B [Metallosphaera sedula]AKV73784.1 succinate dehydrogenase [Metallosphaera sedula]AKV76024.1 succinate dehydrogenase [Metallosphaera sedula]AKV78275.1 succinate dehydrogenase [Metallosphaera sedula]